jgi:putative FmdB family regulatory protein
MPTYEYACEKCGHQFDFFQSIKADPLTTCPKEKCGRKKWGRGRLKKQINAGGGLLFKGSGFYTTDYRSEGYKAAAKKESGSSTSGGGGGSGSEAKPASSSNAPGSSEKSASTKAESKPAKPAKTK